MLCNTRTLTSSYVIASVKYRCHRYVVETCSRTIIGIRSKLLGVRNAIKHLFNIILKNQTHYKKRIRRIKTENVYIELKCCGRRHAWGVGVFNYRRLLGIRGVCELPRRRSWTLAPQKSNNTGWKEQ